MIVEQDRLEGDESLRLLGSRRTIYYGHVPPARDWQLSKGYLKAALRASRGDCNNIPYIAPPFLVISFWSLSLCNRRLLRACLGKGLERYWHAAVYDLAIWPPALNSWKPQQGKTLAGEKTQRLPGNPSEIYQNISNCLGQPKDFYITLHPSLYTSL